MKVALLLLWGILSACSSTFHSGKDRPAILLVRRGMILEIDGQAVSGSQYQLWPGRHRIRGRTVEYSHRSGWGFWVNAMPWYIGLPVALIATAVVEAPQDRSPDAPPIVMTKCFVARPGRTYGVHTQDEVGMPKLEIFDETTSYVVSGTCQQPLAP